ncbi:MAG: GDP-mannose 4,6-dehydratase [Bacteriovoracaceae bacterium]|nr:GDP-mannose 4,6-dehydratase [Bacteriovoracaceae bacterium]
MILLTGTAGFIASHIASKLLKNGKSVIGIDNLNNSCDVILKKYRLDQLSNYSNFIFAKVDINNRPSLKKLFEQYNIESVIHLAAMTGVRHSVDNPHVYLETNIKGTLNLLEMMKEHLVKKMLLASSSSLYAGHKMPFNEQLAVNKQISPYAVSKKSAEGLCHCYCHLHGLDVIIYRYFTVYGPAGRPDMSIYRFIKCIDEGLEIELFGDGEQTRDFTYVDDIVNGTIEGLKLSGHHIINLGSGSKPTSINTVIKEIEKLLGKKANIKRNDFQKSDVLATWASISKANELLNWRPTIGITEGIHRTIDWYLKNKQMNQKIALK